MSTLDYPVHNESKDDRDALISVNEYGTCPAGEQADIPPLNPHTAIVEFSGNGAANTTTRSNTRNPGSLYTPKRRPGMAGENVTAITRKAYIRHCSLHARACFAVIMICKEPESPGVTHRQTGHIFSELKGEGFRPFRPAVW